ncbi:MAG: agmatine deiminase family protein [Phycisphaerae bacterium]
MLSTKRILGTAAFVSVLGSFAGIANAQPPIPSYYYAEGTAIPRYETEFEKEYRVMMGDIDLRGATAPPTGPIVCPGEYDPMDAILVAWEGTSGWTSILAQMAAQITTVGDADVFVAVDTVSEQNSAAATIQAQGANMSRVHFRVVQTDSIWMRDYGPRYIYEGDCRAVVDHTYNRPSRVWDNLFPSYYAADRNFAYYELPLVHGGGNYHLDSVGRSHTTRLINNENPGLSELQIHDIWQDYQNVDTTFYTPFPTFVDATQHIDMWMQIIADDAVMISDWPFNVGSTQDNICDQAAIDMANRGYTVHRVPARSLSGTHYTYTNVVMCNDLVLVPTYTHSSIISGNHNAQALAAWQAALPDKTIVQINCQAIVTAAGVMHCIVMHLPAHLGGENPTAYLKNFRGDEVVEPNKQVEIRWISDDNVATDNVDILLSTNGGASFDTVIATMQPDNSAYTWTVPDIYAENARIRVVVRDAEGNTGFDESPANFTINGTPGLVGDLNCDGLVSVADIGPFVLALTDPTGYAVQFPACDINNADINDDDLVSVGDIGGFVALLSGN